MARVTRDGTGAGAGAMGVGTGDVASSRDVACIITVAGTRAVSGTTADAGFQTVACTKAVASTKSVSFARDGASDRATAGARDRAISGVRDVGDWGVCDGDGVDGCVGGCGGLGSGIGCWFRFCDLGGYFCCIKRNGGGGYVGVNPCIRQTLTGRLTDTVVLKVT